MTQKQKADKEKSEQSNGELFQALLFYIVIASFFGLTIFIIPAIGDLLLDLPESDTKGWVDPTTVVQL